MRIAFYAPLKEPDHPVPSGDRAMARLLMQALRAGGHQVELVSTLRSFLAMPEAAAQAAIEAAAGREVERIAANWADPDGRPDLWFTYHPFYKAPDFLGPALAARFALRYAAAEASHAPKRASGSWAGWHAAVEAGLGQADLLVCLTPRDREGLARVPGLRATLIDLPPFIDAAGEGAPGRRLGAASGARVVELVTVAMMRPGDKACSYALLAEALARLPPTPTWRLTIVGAGPVEGVVRSYFADLAPERLRWRGELAAAEVATVLAAGDLHVWPGINEAFGIAYLEAGAAGLPSLAMRSGGVASVVRDGETGLLTPEGDTAAFAAALAGLIGDAALRERLGRAAWHVVAGERTVEAAAAILSAGLVALLPKRARDFA